MKTKIAKEFRWEMSHRLAFHKGLCKNLHGHSYKLRLELEGVPDENFMIIDYYDIFRIVEPLIKSLDHSFLCDKDDTLMIDFLSANGFKHVVMEKASTAENIVEYLIEKIAPEFRKFNNISAIKARVYETDDAYAELKLEF